MDILLIHLEPSPLVKGIAFSVGVVAAFTLAALCYRLLEPLRHGNIATRFVARFVILGMFGWALFAVPILIGGPHVHNGPLRNGTYDTSAFTVGELRWVLVVFGVLGAVVWPLAARRADGDGLDM